MSGRHIPIGANVEEYEEALGPGGSITVTDGSTTVDPATSLEFPSGSVTDAGGGVAQVASGGSVPGAAIVRGPFDIAFDDAGLNDGIAFYTPTVDDILLDAWIEVDTAFDGTTPKADIGTGVNSTSGLFSQAGTFPDLSSADNDGSAGEGVLINDSGNVPLSVAAAIQSSAYRIVPAKFITAAPLKVWVSQNGAIGGTAIGGAAGAGRVFIVTATPLAI